MNDMMWKKACPRCNGNLFIEDIVGDWSIVCLQCGYRDYINREKWHEANLTDSAEPQPDKVETFY